MNKKITTAMLLVLMQSSIYSAQPEEDLDWMQVGTGADGKLEVKEVRVQPTQNQATNTGDQPKVQELSAGCCAVVADLLNTGFEFLKEQAYGTPPFAPHETTIKKEK